MTRRSCSTGCSSDGGGRISGRGLPLRRWAPVLFAVLIAGCNLSFTEETPPAHAVVYGQILGPNGLPAAGAQVRAELLSEGCGAPVAEGRNVGPADANGRYRSLLTEVSAVLVPCVRVVARSAATTSVDSAVAVGGPLQYRRTPVGQLDSVRVDLRLP